MPRTHGARRPRCLGCGYSLTGLTEERCPECSRPFRPDDPRTFDLRPPRDRWRLWAPGLALSCFLGIVGFAALGGTGSTGAGVWIGVPVMAGAVLGYRVQTRWVWLPVLSLTAGICIVLALISANFAGMYCGLMLAIAIFGPFMLGTVLGAGLRYLLKLAGYDQAVYLPLLGFVLIPVVWTLLEGGGARHTTEIAVSTSRVVVGSPEKVWACLMFFEEVESEPPLLMRIALPRPVRVEGAMARVGDRRVCVYTAGRLTKEIVSVEPARELGFAVVEQEFEPSAVLTGGSFTLEPAGDARTLLTLQTRYIPVHSPRFAWRWAEWLGVRTLHTHVLNGIELAMTRAESD